MLPATTNTIRIKHRRKAVTSKSVSGHVRGRQDQASKKSNKIQKYLRPRQIASKASIERKQWPPKEHSLKILKNLEISSLIFSYKFLTKLYHFVTIFTNLKPSPFSFVLESWNDRKQKKKILNLSLKNIRKYQKK